MLKFDKKCQKDMFQGNVCYEGPSVAVKEFKSF